MGNKYKSYQKSLNFLELEALKERREKLCLKFATRCLKNDKAKNMFPLHSKSHEMGTRNGEKLKVQHANTIRLKNFSIIYMQNLLNEDKKRS